MPLSLKNKVAAGFAAALLILAIIGVLSFRSTRALLDTVDEQSNAAATLTAIESTLANLNAAEGAHRGYMITADASHLPRYHRALLEVDRSLTELLALSQSYPEVATRVAQFEREVRARMILFEERTRIYKAGGLGAVAPLIRGDPQDRTIILHARSIEQSVRRHQTEHELRSADFARTTMSVITLGSVLALLFLAFAGVIIHREIEARHRAYLQLGEREERLHDVVENAAELIQLLTPDGRITNANSAWFKTLHYTREELNQLDILDIVEEEYRDAWRAAVAEALDGERVHNLRVDVRTREGERINLIGSLSCRFEGESAVSIRGIFRDVTATERASAELRAEEFRRAQYLEAMPLGIFVINAAGMTVYANDAAQQILGRGILHDAHPSELAIVYSAYCAGEDKLYPTDKLPILRALHGENSTIEDMEIQRGDQRIPLQVTAAPIRAADGSIEGAIAAFIDISDRRAVERLKDELISVVSHELRTPLTSIRGALGLVGSGRLGTLNDQGRKMMDIAINDTDRLVRLINDMLDIERMESGRVAMKKGTCEAGKIISEAVESVRTLASRSSVHIESDVVNTSVWCDSDRIVQTLTNLLGNAIKFSPPNGTVTVQARVVGGDVEFRITDQGRGIPKEKIETIFDRFHQVDASDAREKGGAGLGLAISRSIIVQHGGRIWAESDGQNGSTFVFTLPRSTQSSPASDENASGTLLLVAEDDSSAAEVLKGMLHMNGYAVAVAGNGRTAIEMAAELHPAAILLDIVMPEMNGWEAIEALKANSETKDIPVIVVSGLAPANGADERVVAWLGKPFAQTDLAAALQSAFRTNKTATVLIVEDDENLAAVLGAQFETSGLHTVSATTGSQAIRLAQENTPDLLVLDLMLPERDGFDVVDWLRQHEQLRNLPVVVYTALELDASQKQKLTLGPSVFLTKSKEEPQEVAQRVALLLRHINGDTGEGAHG